LSALILLTLVTEATNVMRFAFSGGRARACRIADAIISPANEVSSLHRSLHRR